MLPQRISLKRRASDDKIDALRFGDKKDGKRRHTDVFFVRQVAHTGSRNPPLPNAPAVLSPKTDPNGIPTVLATVSGAERTDFAKLRSQLHDRSAINNISAASRIPRKRQANGSNSLSPDPAAAQNQMTQHVSRRFYLTPDLTDNLHKTSNAARVSKTSKKFKSPRPLLATFVEKKAAAESDDSTAGPVSSKADNLVVSSKEVPTSTLAQCEGAATPPSARKIGQSMNEHPSTWDMESDQLADELAAFALELDPGANVDHEVSSKAESHHHVHHLSEDMELDGGYVFETFVRVSVEDAGFDSMGLDTEANIGVLIIDEEVEDLWQEYLNEDSEVDEDWDEEDSNAEDNPAHDYPEEEVDTDDEHGRNAYRFRNDHSDEDSIDEDYSE